jgi:hypothetical protein
VRDAVRHVQCQRGLPDAGGTGDGGDHDRGRGGRPGSRVEQRVEPRQFGDSAGERGHVGRQLPWRSRPPYRNRRVAGGGDQGGLLGGVQPERVGQHPNRARTWLAELVRLESTYGAFAEPGTRGKVFLGQQGPAPVLA